VTEPTIRRFAQIKKNICLARALVHTILVEDTFRPDITPPRLRNDEADEKDTKKVS